MGRNNTEHELTHIMHKKVYTGQLEEFFFLLFIYFFLHELLFSILLLFFLSNFILFLNFT